MTFNFLIDTNIFIPLEPGDIRHLEDNTTSVFELQRKVNESGCSLFVHPLVAREIARDRDSLRRALRTQLLDKYPVLKKPPALSATVRDVFGSPAESSHDWVDAHLVECLAADCVHFLISEDSKLRKRAAALGLDNRVHTIQEAIHLLKTFFDAVPTSRVIVNAALCHELSQDDPIFVSLAHDYAEFSEWFRKCRREQRQSWVIRPVGERRYAGIAIVKREGDPPLPDAGKTLKICTFKISPDWSGRYFGELLLKTVFAFLTVNRYRSAYVEILPKHSSLIEMFESYGFSASAERTHRGEVRLLKNFLYYEDDLPAISPLQLNIRFGPHIVNFEKSQSFVVPIQPRFHDILFGSDEGQIDLFDGLDPCANAIRKAYISNSNIRKIAEGDLLLFYVSQSAKAVIAMGITESTLVSTDPTQVAQHVSRRTVYSLEEIQRLCQKEALVLLFREVSRFHPPISLNELKREGILAAAPQSILRLDKEKHRWVQKRLVQ
jgi:L-amino acid N-acyltransferase YncA/predicted RNA-binding protein with PUA-like domain